MSPDGVINYSSETMQMESGTYHPNILIGNCTGKGLEEVEDPQFDPNDDIASCKIKYSAFDNPTPGSHIQGHSADNPTPDEADCGGACPEVSGAGYQHAMHVFYMALAVAMGMPKAMSVAWSSRWLRRRRCP